MPSWAIHLVTAKKLVKIQPIQDKNAFYLGNLLPDIPNGYIIANPSHPIKHGITHWDREQIIEGKKQIRCQPELFQEKYQDKMNNPIVLGYYTHILTDYYWNALTYDNYGIYNEQKERIGLKLKTGNYLCDKDEARKIKTNDFKLYAWHLYKTNQVQEIHQPKNILTYLKDLSWLKLQEIDIQKTVDYIQEKRQKKDQILEPEEKNEYQIYSLTEMKQNLEASIEFILEKGKNITR